MRALTEHLGLKLVAGLIAYLLWAFLAGETEVAASMPLKVQYRNVPADLEISANPPETLYVKVRGPASRLSPGSLTEMPVTLDLRNVHGPGEQTFNLTARDLRLPAGVELLRVVPSQLRLSFDRVGRRPVPVEVMYRGGPPDGYRIVSQRVYPESVPITGPEAELRHVQTVRTDPIDLSSTIGRAEFRVPVHLTQPNLRLDSSEPVQVTVELEKNPE